MHTFSFKHVMEGLSGVYCCTKYVGTPLENDWHHVTVTAEEVASIANNDGRGSAGQLTRFLWTNRAVVSWSLSYHPKTDEDEKEDDDGGRDCLSVGKDCPYWQRGYVQCLVVRDGRDASSKITALVGPNRERYDRVGDLPCPRRRVERRSPMVLPWWRADRQPDDSKPEYGRKEEGRNPNNRHAFVLPLKSTGGDWGDLAFLAAVPASSCRNGGRSAVLVPEDDDAARDDDAIADFVKRYRPNRMDVFQNEVGIKEAEEAEKNSDDAGAKDGVPPMIEHHKWDDLHLVTVALSTVAWPWALDYQIPGTGLQSVVVASDDDYAAALLASSVAARVHAPLFFTRKDGTVHPSVSRQIQRFSPPKVVLVGEGFDSNQFDAIVDALFDNFSKAKVTSRPKLVHLKTTASAIDWLKQEGLTVDYLAVANPMDRTADESCSSRKISLTSPVYAARRQGLVLPIKDVSISCGQTGGDKKALIESLSCIRQNILGHERSVEHIALIGGFNVVPTCRTTSDCNNSGIFAVTDIPYGQSSGSNPTDKKKFRDFAIGRVYAEGVCCCALLAARTANYELLVDGNWDKTVVESGSWTFPEATGLFEMAGAVKGSPRHLVAEDLRRMENACECAAFLHKDHSSATNLGNSVGVETAVLFAPAVVVSRGCHAAGIDEGRGPDSSTIVGRMLGRGCICFAGSPRSPTTQTTLIEVAFLHELLYGRGKNGDKLTVGQAMRTAFNKAVVHHLDGGEMPSYCLENHVLIGDPALSPSFAGAGCSRADVSKPFVAPASSSFDGSIVTVVGPSKWTKTPIHKDQLLEWKYNGDLSTFVAPRVEQETVWCKDEYDTQELYHTISVSLPLNTCAVEVVPLDATEIVRHGQEHTVRVGIEEWADRWWQSRRYFLHKNHSDNSVQVCWRLRMLDYDMQTGDINAELRTARFLLVLESNTPRSREIFLTLSEKPDESDQE